MGKSETLALKDLKKAQRGRQPDLKKRAQVLRATNKILKQQGFDSLTIRKVSEEACVTRAFIYKWWKGDKLRLVTEALPLEPKSMIAPDTGDFSKDLTVLVDDQASLYETPYILRAIVSLTVEAQNSSELASELTQGLTMPSANRWKVVFDNAKSRRDIMLEANSKAYMLLSDGALKSLFNNRVFSRDAAVKFIVELISERLCI